MEQKILFNILKILATTIFILFLINVIGVTFEYLRFSNNGVNINSFTYENFKFLINEKETYNQFSSKYIFFNILIFIIVSLIYFRRNAKTVNK